MAKETPNQLPYEEAWEAAHAEKPFRDAMLKYGEHLSDDEKEKLLWLASKEAEEAVEKYSKTKGEERERAKILLKSKALGAIEQGTPNKLDGVALREKAKEFIAWALAQMAEPDIDDVLGSKWSPETKQKALQKLQGGLLEGLLSGGSSGMGGFIAEKQLPHPRPGEQKISTHAIYNLKGLFIKELLISHPISAIDVMEALKDNAPVGGSPYDEKVMLQIVEKWRVSPEIDVIIDAINDTRQIFDGGLQRMGFVWDPDAKKYIRM